MDKSSSFIINILPCQIQSNGEFSLTFWKNANTKFSLKNNTTNDADKPITEDTFYKVYNSRPSLKSYFRGRKLYGEVSNVENTHKVMIFEKKKFNHNETGQEEIVLKQFNHSSDNNELIIWDHERAPSDSAKLENNLQNQWYDIKEMIQVNQIIHE